MIELDNVTKEYDDVKVVSGVSFAVEQGSVFGFLGANGAGKTTTMKMLVGITKPTSGHIRIGGKSPSIEKTREQISFMPENPYFYDYLTGEEFVEFAASLFQDAKIKSSSDRMKLLERVGIAYASKRSINTYSKGMKQRLGFAQALVNDPSYVFLDEPLDGLDPIGRKEIKDIIRGLQKEGRTIFFNSHILSDIEEVCSKIGVIHLGKILFTGSVNEFCNGKRLEERFVEVVEEYKRNNTQNDE